MSTHAGTAPGRRTALGLGDHAVDDSPVLGWVLVSSRTQRPVLVSAYHEVAVVVDRLCRRGWPWPQTEVGWSDAYHGSHNPWVVGSSLTRPTEETAGQSHISGL